MAIFITGATGYIGQRLAINLAEEGQVVHALVRDAEKARMMLNHPGIKLFQGDILEPSTITPAIKDCRQCYHLAALASVWHKDPLAFNACNVTGLKNVLDACLAAGVTDVLFTSTAGVAGNSLDGERVAEYTHTRPKLETLYERSKVAAEQLLIGYVTKGLRGIIVNPSRVFGPGLLTESNGFTRLMKMYIDGNWKIRPGQGNSVGNYVYIDDTIRGLRLAMEKAKPGERYMLGGINATYNQFFDLINEQTGVRRKMHSVPLGVMLILSYVQLLRAELTGRQPLITPPFVRKYNKQWIVSSAKAENELGYTITPLAEGIAKTLAWLQAGHKPSTSLVSSGKV